MTVRSQATAVIDQSKAKGELAQLEADESQQIARAQRELASGRPMRLSDFGILEPATFHLLLDLLGEALAIRTDPRQPVAAVSMDGALIIQLGPADDAAPLAEIGTLTGVLRGPDCEVTISYAQDALALEASELTTAQESSDVFQ